MRRFALMMAAAVLIPPTALPAVSPPSSTVRSDHPRMIVLSDSVADPDDTPSFIRLTPPTRTAIAWFHNREIGQWSAPILSGIAPKIHTVDFTGQAVSQPRDPHSIVAVTDKGTPPPHPLSPGDHQDRTTG